MIQALAVDSTAYLQVLNLDRDMNIARRALWG